MARRGRASAEARIRWRLGAQARQGGGSLPGGASAPPLRPVLSASAAAGCWPGRWLLAMLPRADGHARASLVAMATRSEAAA